MSVLLVVGAGPGISHATARRFGLEGFSVALIGRDPDHLEAGVQRLAAEGVSAHAYVADVTNPDVVHGVVEAVRGDLGPIDILLFTAFGNSQISNVLQVAPAAAVEPFRLGVAGLLAVVQATAEDLRNSEVGAILAANGAVGEDTVESNQFSASAGVDGVALESAAKSKLLGLLAERLRNDGIYVGEISINGTIQGSPYATSNAIAPEDIADRFWRMATSRTENRVHIAKSS